MARFRSRLSWAWTDPAYHTRDHVIPFRLFWAYLPLVEAELAHERLQMTRAVVNAISVSFAKDRAGIPRALQTDIRLANLESVGG